MKSESGFLPDSVQEIADVVGRENALKLAGCSNGCFYVPQPRHITPSHRLSKIIGFDAALALSEEFPGFILKPASCRFVYTNWRNQSIRRFHGEGMPRSEIAELFSLTDRHVRNILNAAY